MISWVIECPSNIGGVASIDRLAELCRIGENSKVLVVGCGTGGNSCYLPKPMDATLLELTLPKIWFRKFNSPISSWIILPLIIVVTLVSLSLEGNFRKNG
jgi:hypothetical protein